MAINDKDFYASHGISYDIEEMQIEYTKRVIRQAKIEVLTELLLAIQNLDTPPKYKDEDYFLVGTGTCQELIQQKIDKLKEE